MKIQVVKFSIKHGDKVYRKSDTLDVPSNIAKQLIEGGIAQAVVLIDKEKAAQDEANCKAATDKAKAENEETKCQAASDTAKAEQKDNPDFDTNGNDEENDDDVEGLPPVEVEKIVKPTTKAAAKKPVRNGK